MSTVKLEIKGNFLKITDNIASKTIRLISRIVTFSFSKNDTYLNLRAEQGTNQVTYSFPVNSLVDKDGSFFGDVLSLEDFLSEALGSDNKTSKSITENISGTYNVDWSAGGNWDLTLTSNTIITQTNIPASGFEKTITIHVVGDFALTLPTEWVVIGGGSYDGVNGSQIVVQSWDNGKYHTVINEKV